MNTHIPIKMPIRDMLSAQTGLYFLRKVWRPTKTKSKITKIAAQGVSLPIFDYLDFCSVTECIALFLIFIGYFSNAIHSYDSMALIWTTFLWQLELELHRVDSVGNIRLTTYLKPVHISHEYANNLINKIDK